MFFDSALGHLAQAANGLRRSGQCEAPLFLDQICEAGKATAENASKAITAPVRLAAGGAVDMITSWVADGAQWILGKVVNFIDDSTSPDLNADWFTERYEFMIGLAALVVVPILLLAAMRAVMNQDVSQLLRSFFLYLPVAILGTFLAVVVTRMLLSVTDAMSAAVAQGVGGDVKEIAEGVTQTLGQASPASATVPSFAIFFGALFLMIGAFVVWLELLIRSAAVTVSVFFMPLILATLVWPATSRWTRRLVETILALILSKFVIVAVISLATAALAEPAGGGFGTVMGAAALMLMAAFSPMALLKLMPLAEGAAVGHLDGLGRRPIQSVAPGSSAHQSLSLMRSKVPNASAGRAAAAGVAAAPIGAAAVTTAAARGATRAGRQPGAKLSRAVGSEPEKTERPTGGNLGSGNSEKPIKSDD